MVSLFLFKQKTAYEMRISDWGSDVCSSDLLAFEPPDYGPLLGAPVGGGTVGGIVACNLAGPRRFKAGAARDHFLGFEAISGRGEAFKSGGRRLVERRVGEGCVRTRRYRRSPYP